METKLARIAQLSNENPNMVFTSVGHLIDRELLAKCHEEMDADKAVGIDGITKDAYSVMLEEKEIISIVLVAAAMMPMCHRCSGTFVLDKDGWIFSFVGKVSSVSVES